jgi:hypothetical protein
MEYHELKLLEKDLYEGNIAREIAKRLKDIEEVQAMVCPVCGKSLGADEEKYKLIFGPEDFKKKASFCGKDCLLYFMNKMKTVEAGR